MSPTRTRSTSICAVTSPRAASDRGEMSPKPTVASTVTVKYTASRRLRSSLKLSATLSATAT